MNNTEWQEFDTNDSENSTQSPQKDPIPLEEFIGFFITVSSIGIIGAAYISGYEKGVDSVECNSALETQKQTSLKRIKLSGNCGGLDGVE